MKVKTVRTLAPKPIFTNVIRSWHVRPGMTFAVAEDIERRIWIVESCPVGTYAWTVEQAANLPRGHRTRPVLLEAVRLGRQLMQERAWMFEPSAESVRSLEPLVYSSTECNREGDCFDRPSPFEQQYDRELSGV